MITLDIGGQSLYVLLNTKQEGSGSARRMSPISGKIVIEAGIFRCIGLQVYGRTVV